jgi:hypothetical protein
MRILRYVAGILIVIVAVIVLVNAAPNGRRGILVASSAGKFIGDANFDDQNIHHTIGFHRCRYFVGIGFFETIEGQSCPWFGVDDKRISNVRPM